MFFLKEDTAADIKLGPFVDKTDGVTYETGLAAAMDHADTGVRLSKNGGAFADRHEGTEPVYDAFGYYLVKLDATDTNTPGTLKVIFGAEATCLPCEANFQIVSANVYDSLFAAATTDYLDVQVKAIDANAITATAINADAITEAKIADNAFSNEHFAAGALTSAEITSAAGCAVASIANNAITAASINDGAITNAKVADDVDVNVKTMTAGAITAASLNADMDAELATIIWNAAVASYGGAGTYGQAVEDTLADTNELQTDLANGGRLDLLIDGVKAKTDSLTFTVANQVDANIQYINDTAVTGDGDATPWGPV